MFIAHICHAQVPLTYNDAPGVWVPRPIAVDYVYLVGSVLPHYDSTLATYRAKAYADSIYIDQLVRQTNLMHDQVDDYISVIVDKDAIIDTFQEEVTLVDAMRRRDQWLWGGAGILAGVILGVVVH